MRIRFIYFKATGKYYSEGYRETEKHHLHEMFAEAKQLLASGVRPGLINGHSGFHVVVDVPEYPFNVPQLFINAA